MGSRAYQEFVKNSFDVDTLRKELSSGNGEFPDWLRELTGDELYWVIYRTFKSSFLNNNAAAAEEAPEENLRMPVLLPEGVPNIQPKKLEVHQIFVNTMEEAHSKALLTELTSHDISIVQNLPSVLALDMDMFRTKVLTETQADYQMEVLVQPRQRNGDNLDRDGKPTWAFKLQLKKMLLKEYLTYQDRELQKEKSEEAYSQSKEPLMFGTNFDLNDEEIWSVQLKELSKLPEWMQHDGRPNFLSVRYTEKHLLGMNTVQMYLKVKGSRTPGHQENNNFCSLNLNVGPGDTEWFGVPESHWRFIDAMCKIKNVNFQTSGSTGWWPNIQDLINHGCPFYRFLQKPGELVFVNIGCVHWVQAAGACNNVSWNVGPFKAVQYAAAMERYEWNKIEKFYSLVHMESLSWNLARHPNINWKDPIFVRMIQDTLIKSIISIAKTMAYIQCVYPQMQSILLPKLEDQQNLYCPTCLQELFCVLFTEYPLNLLENDAHCLKCAEKHLQDLQDFCFVQTCDVQVLINEYTNFVLKWRPEMHEKMATTTNDQEDESGIEDDTDCYCYF